VSRRPAPLPGGPLVLRAADGVRLTGWELPGPAGARPDQPGDSPGWSGPPTVVLVHGFSGALTRPALRAVALGLAAVARVVVVEQRGHGGSGGRSTLGEREVLDVDAAVGHARATAMSQPSRVVTVGFSMGGSSVLRQAALALDGGSVAGRPVGSAPDAVVTVSAVSRWWVRDTAAMRRLHHIVLTRPGRVVGRALGARIDPVGWTVGAEPLDPAASAARIGAAGVPLLVVHGEQDTYFTDEHPRALVAAAGTCAELWLLPGFGHAEAAAAADPGVLARLAAHLPVLLARACRPEPAGPLAVPMTRP